MLGKDKHYIVNPRNITSADAELVGDGGIKIAQLQELNITTPESFIITTPAFDDFVIAAGLVEKIGTALAKLNSEETAVAKLVSDEIAGHIYQASFPGTLLHPLVQAYKSLSGLHEKYVELTPSWIFDANLVPIGNAQISNVYGEAGLLYAVKQVWAELFSPEALLLRHKHEYRGGLSMAIIVSKMIPAEASGKAFSIEPITQSPKFIQIEAVLGLPEHETLNTSADIYKLEKADLHIVEKNIIGQEKMFIRKGSTSNGKDALMSVKISPEWRKHQKLEDTHILYLGQMVKELEQSLGKPQEFNWCYEMGRFYITKAVDFIPVTNPLDQQISKAISESDIEIIPATDNIEVTEDHVEISAPEKPRAKRVNIKRLADEVQDIVEQKLPPPVLPEITAELDEQPEIPLSIDNIETITDPLEDNSADPSNGFGLITQFYLNVTGMTSSRLALAQKFDGVFFDATEMVLNHKILPESLTQNKSELAKLIESFALDIATAGKVATPKPLIYQFSNIGQAEQQLLLGEGQVTSDIDACERFISKPEAMFAEIVAIRKANSAYGVRNTRLILPDLRSGKELVSAKKILSSQNIRRSKLTWLGAEISQTSLVYQAKEIGYGSVDMFILDLHKISQATFGGAKQLNEHRWETLRPIIEKLIETGHDLTAEVVINASKVEFLPIVDLVEAGTDGIILDRDIDNSVLKRIKEIEVSKLKPAAKTRGRKPKALL